MLNLSIAPQVNPSTDHPVTMVSSGSADTKEPAVEEFGKILEREVSEATNKRETNNTSSTPESSEELMPSKEDTGTTVAVATAATVDTMVAATAITTTTTATTISSTVAATATATAETDIPAAGTSIVDRLFLDVIAGAYQADQSVLPLDPAANPGDPDNTVTASILPVVSSVLSQNPPVSQDSEQAAGSRLLSASQMLQQKPAQVNLAANNFTYSPGDLWQSLDMADSAVSGKFLPFSSEMNEVIPINMGESIFPASDELIPTQLSGLSSTTSVAPLNATPQAISVDLPVGQPKWTGEFAQKIVWLTTQQHQVAEIRLNPAHLGPVEVMLSITQDQATAQFLSPHAAVREAIEAALPRLKEMMAENGIQLGNVMVSADSFQRENRQQQAHHPAKGAIDVADTGTGTETTGQVGTIALPSRHNGMVNTYA